VRFRSRRVRFSARSFPASPYQLSSFGDAVLVKEWISYSYFSMLIRRACSCGSHQWRSTRQFRHRLDIGEWPRHRQRLPYAPCSRRPQGPFGQESTFSVAILRVFRYLTWLRRLLRNGLFLLRSSSTELRPIVFGFRLLESRRSFMGGASIGFPFLVLAKPIAFWIVLARPCGLPLPFVHVGHVSKSFFT